MSTPANSLPCSAGCGCWTDRMVDNGSGEARVPLCIFCEDEIPCPASRALASQPAPPSPTKNSPRERQTQESEAIRVKEKFECAADGCNTMTASKVGYCGKHFYMSKTKPAKSSPARKANGNGHAGNGKSDDRLPELVVQLNEAQMNAVLASLSLDKKAQLIRSLVALA